jgi:hypothetical protein
MRGGGRSYFLRPRKQRENANPTVGGAIASTLGALSSSLSSGAIPMVVQRFDGSSGSVLVSSGVPLKSGAMYPADVTNNKGAVFVNGVEQTRHISALYGTFPNGSLRAVLVQFTYTIPSATAITAEFRPAETATAANASVTTVTYTNVNLHARFLPSSATYLCETEVALEPMLPASLDDSATAAWQTKASSTFTYLPAFAYSLSRMGPAHYDYPRNYLAHWCRTANTQYYAEALTRNREVAANYFTPSAAQNSWVNGGEVAGTGGAPGGPSDAQEQWSLWDQSLVTCYWLTGWNLLWRLLCHEQAKCWGGKPASTAVQTPVADAFTGWINSGYGARFNIGKLGSQAAIAGYLTEATHATNHISGYAARAIDWPTEFPRLIATFDQNKFTSADQRLGLVGVCMTTTDADLEGGGWDGPVSPNEADGMGGLTNFQLAIVGRDLMTYYRYVDADSRIPAMLQALADYMITQIRLWQSGDLTGDGVTTGVYVTTYYGQNSTATGTLFGNVTLGMWANVFGWVYAYTGDSTYLTWLTRCEQAAVLSSGDPAGSNRNKEWAERFGWSNGASYYKAGGSVRASWSPAAIVQPPTN